MAIKLNEVRIAGNLGKDPEITTMRSGELVANFSVAVTDRWKDKQTGEQKDRTEWIKGVAFGQPAKFLQDYAKQGDNLYMEGELRTRSYDKDGEKRYVTEVVANRVQLASKLNAAADDRRPQDDLEDSIPFDARRQAHDGASRPTVQDRHRNPKYER